VQRYHSDNGRFMDKDLLEDVKAQRQAIMYCRVHAHHQNGKAEKRIRNLQEKTRLILLHAIHQWPNVITLQLWPYALCVANKIKTPRTQDGLIPWTIFARTKEIPNLDRIHPFGFPA